MSVLHSNRSKVIAICILACLLLCSMFARSTSFERKEISEDVVRRMDILITNEIYNYDTNTELCQVTAENVAYFRTTECRRDFFQYLSDQGYEVGNVVLKLFDDKQPKFRADISEYERLHRLAVQGDKSALCLSGVVFSQLSRDEIVSWPYTFATEFEFVKKGAAMGLPVCLFLEAQAYQVGVNSYSKNLDIALNKWRDSAVAGVYRAQVAMSTYFLDEGISDPNNPGKKLVGLEDPKQIEAVIKELKHYQFNYTLKDLHKVNIAFCWARIADKYKTGNVETVHRRLESVAYENKQLIHAEYVHLAKKWDLREVPYELKPTKAEDCITMEKALGKTAINGDDSKEAKLTSQ